MARRLELDSGTCSKDRREAEGGDKYNETENCHDGGAGLGQDPGFDSFMQDTNDISQP